MKLQDIFSDKYCKICKRKCTLETFIQGKIFLKEKTIFSFALSNQNQIICIETGSYGIKLSTTVINIEDETFKIEKHKDITNYTLDELKIIIKFYCANENHKYIKHSDEADFDWGSSKKFVDKLDYQSDSLEHYFVVYKCMVSIQNNTINAFQISEYLENKDYILTKDFIKNSMTVDKKFKRVKLNTILEREFETIDFDKLLENTNLLK